jgi:hypothetical protein
MLNRTRPERRQKNSRIPLYVGAVIMLLVGACYLRLTAMMTQIVHTYKPEAVVQRGNPDELDRRPAYFPDAAAMIYMEWYTYDNEVIDRPPYKLSIGIQARVPTLRRVMVDEVQIRSSKGRTYAFSDTLRWPVVIEIDPEKGGGYRTLEPAFPFGYGEGEEITTRIRLRMVTDAGERPVLLETRWLPVRVKRWVPIV